VSFFKRGLRFESPLPSPLLGNMQFAASSYYFITLSIHSLNWSRVVGRSERDWWTGNRGVDSRGGRRVLCV